MTFSRANPVGYALGERLPSADANIIDLNQSRAVDGYAGGSYSPSTAITILGRGLVVWGDGLGVYGALGVNCSAMFNAAYSATFAGGVNIAPTATCTIQDGATFGAENRADVTCTSYTRTVYINSTTPGVMSTHWIASFNATAAYWIQDSDTISTLYLPLAIVPAAGAITELEIQLQGETGHVGLPATMPSLSLMRQDPDGSTLVATNTQSDTSATVVAYEATHPITLTGLNVQPLNYVWMVRVSGESSTNALAGLMVYSLKITWSSVSIGL